MNSRFKDQVAIVAGGAQGIGRAISKRLAKEGASVAILDINRDHLKSTVSEISPNGGIAWGHEVDLVEEESLKEVIHEIYDKHQRLDIMVNCAGIIGPSGVNILDYDANDFERVLSVNLTGAFLITKHCLGFMLKRNYGRILHLASIGGKEGNPGMVGYAASKSGLMGLVKGVGKEYAHTGVTVNGLAPAVIATEFNENTDPKMLQYMVDKIPMKRLGTVEEVASLSCWIISPEASFNTAAIFDLSGGRATY